MGYLDYLMQQNPGLLQGIGSAANTASQMQQTGAQAQQLGQQAQQKVAAARQQNDAEAAQGMQQALQQQAADEARRKQTIMQIASLAAGGLGGGEAAAGGAGTEATKAMANEAAEKAMLEVAPGMAAEKGMSLLGNYADLGNAVGVTPYYDPRRLGLNFGF
jgi:hypothetical protein